MDRQDHAKLVAPHVTTILIKCMSLFVNKRLFKLGKLYYKFIKGSELEAQGWTAAKLASILEQHGVIKIVKTQSQDAKGRFLMIEPKYYECEGMAISRTQFNKLIGNTLRARCKKAQGEK